MIDPEPSAPIDDMIDDVIGDVIGDVITRQLAEVKAGSGLRDGIVERFQHRHRRQSFLTMAGAVVMVLAVVLGGSRMVRESAPVQVAVQDWQRDAVRFVDGDFNLARFKPGNAELQRIFSSIEPGATLRLPAPLAADRPLGCREVVLHGVKALLVCYSFPSGEQLHLFVTSPEAFREPLTDRPVFTQEGEWQTAAWTRDGLAYVAVGQGEMERLLKLLALRRV